MDFKYKIIAKGTMKAQNEDEVYDSLSCGFDGWEDLEDLDIKVSK